MSRMAHPPRARWQGALAAALIALAACGGGGGSSTPPPVPTPLPPLGAGENALDDPTVYSTAQHASLPDGVTEAAAGTKHSIVLNGSAPRHTATPRPPGPRDPPSKT